MTPTEALAYAVKTDAAPSNDWRLNVCCTAIPAAKREATDYPFPAIPEKI